MITHKIISITRKDEIFTASVEVADNAPQAVSVSIAHMRPGKSGKFISAIAPASPTKLEKIELTKEQAKAIHKLAELNNMVNQIDYDGDVENWSMYFNRDFVVGLA